MKLKNLYLSFLLILLFLNVRGQDKILWGDSVPEKWNGSWLPEYLTACEESNFTYTADNRDILEYFAMLKRSSEHVHIFDMFTSDRGRNCPVLVMANPRITSPEEARESGKTVVYLQGGIHPGECEGKEALLMLTREILLGKKNYLLDKLIIMVCPNFNVDGNETRSVSRSTPYLEGTRANAYKFDVNRDAIKLETTNMRAAYERVFNTWDPVLIYDTHRMGRVTHGYPIVYAGSNVATAHPGPRDYVTYRLFPAITEQGRENGNIEIFFHGGYTKDKWPPSEYTHDNAIWSTEGKFMVSGYGLRNRMAILVETVGYISFEKKVYSQYVFADELMKYCYEHGSEMKEECEKADREVVENIREKASGGKLMNFVEAKYVSDGKYDMYGYKEIDYINKPGTSISIPNPEIINSRPELLKGVELITRPVGTKRAAVPRGYLIPADMKFLVDKLITLGLDVNKLDKAVTIEGQEFIINRLFHERSGGYDMTRLDGAFKDLKGREVPQSYYHLDMAQPLANVAFYALEPQVGDGFVGWNLLDEYLVNMGVEEQPVAYPVIKYFTLED